MLHELRHAIRRLLGNPAFTAVAIVTIASTIGVNTAVFSVVQGLLLRPLPYPEPDRIVSILERRPGGGRNSISTLNYLDWANQNSVFESLAAEAGWRVTLTGRDEPLLIAGARVSSRYFDLFGVTAARGRTFLPHEDQPGRDRVVLLSHKLWENRFGADPSILNRTIVLDDEPYTVVGILPAGGPFDRAMAQIWRPLAFENDQLTRDFRWLAATARLKPGVTIERARAEMEAVGQRLATAYPASNKDWGVAIEPLADVIIGPDLRTAVTMLFAATVLVLLIGCANLANLALARSVSRQREMAVRAAVGANPWQLARPWLFEIGVLALCGGVIGVGAGFALMIWLQSLIPPTALPPAVDIRMDTPVLLFTLGIALVTGSLFGIGPALRAATTPLTGALQDGGHRASTDRRSRRLRSGLIVAEIALAFVLLVASGLLTRSFLNLLNVDPGFDPTNVFTATLPVHQARHPDPRELGVYLASIRAAVEAVPGVRQAAMTSALPLEGRAFGMRYAIAGRDVTAPLERRLAHFKIVSPSYFDALGIVLRHGRVLNDRDTAGAPPVAVINETLARQEFPGENPVGRVILTHRLVPGAAELGEEIGWQIVGVVAGEKLTGLGNEVSAAIYASHEQSPTYNINLIVRGNIAPQFIQDAVRSAVQGVNRSQALGDVRTLDQVLQQSMMGNRVMNLLFTAFASIALLLAAVGIYGVMSYTAAERRQEMGIRAALGASAGTLYALIIWNGLRLALLGLVLGLAGAFAVTGVMSALLYGVESDDPLTLIVAGAVLLGIAGLASVLPARRFTSVDLMDVLRS